MRREAVHEDGVGRHVHHGLVDLIAHEGFAAGLLLPFLPHRRPYVGVDRCCSVKICDVVRESDRMGPGVDATRALEHGCRRLVAGRADLRQGGRRAAEPGDPDLERNPGPVRRLLEKHRDVAAAEGPLRPPAGFDRMGPVEDLAQLLAVEVGHVNEVVSRERDHSSDHDRLAGYKRGSISSPATTGEIARSRNESNSGSLERSLGSSRSLRIRSRQAEGSSPTTAGLKVRAGSSFSWMVRRSVTLTFGQEWGSVSVTDSMWPQTARISCRPWMTSSRSRNRASRAGGQLRSWTRHQITTPAPPAAPAANANPATAAPDSAKAPTVSAPKAAIHATPATPRVTIKRRDRT